MVIAAIAVSLVLLVGGSFAVSGIITSGHNLNAMADLDKVSTAEVSQAAANDSFIGYRQTGTAAGDQALEDSGVGFHPTAGGKLSVVLSPAPNAAGGPAVAGQTVWGYAAIAQSAAVGGPKFIRTSASQLTADVDASGAAWKLTGSNAAKVTADLAKLGITVAQLKTALG